MHVYLISLASVSCYALLNILVKKSMLDGIPPFVFISITMAFLSLWGLVGVFIKNKDFALSHIPLSAWISFIGFAFVNFIAFVLLTKAIGLMPVVQYQLVSLATPVIGAFLAYFLLHETSIDWRTIIGFGVMCLGFLIVISKELFAQGRAG